MGPRPERPEFVPALLAEIAGYSDRIAVRPGITGLAQLNLPPDSDLNSVHRKLVLDCEYIGRASLWLNVRLLACTSLRVVKLPGRWLLRLVWAAPDGDAVVWPPPATSPEATTVPIFPRPSPPVCLAPA